MCVDFSRPSGLLGSLLHAFLSFRLDYCNSLMARLPLCEVKRLPKIQIAAARLFGSVSRRSSLLSVLHDELQWLTIKQRIDFIIIIIIVIVIIIEFI